jgi:pimeloyl-ACP methyl ester carboxylesterase
VIPLTARDSLIARIVPEVEIEVRTHATGGPLVVALHGGPGAVGSMRQLAEDLSDEFAVLEPLQRQNANVPLTVETHVADLAQIVPAPAAIIGHSWGAMLALSFASTCPSLVHKIALIGCGTYDAASRATYTRVLRERLGPDGRRDYDDLNRQSSTARDAAELDRLRRARAVLSMRAQAVDPIDFGDGDEAGPDPLGGWDDWRGDALGAEQTWADVLRLQAEEVEPQRFSAITVPVLMLHGHQDPHPGRATAETLRAHIRQLDYVEFQDCGHTPWAERKARDRFLEELRSFLR